MSAPVPMFGTQDLKDDDGAVIDSLLIETDAPPNLAEATDTITITAPQEIRPITRLITGYQVMASTFSQPMMIAPGDPNRQEMSIRVTSLAASPTVEDYVLMADESNKVQTATTSSGISARMRNGNEYNLSDHTGPVWIMPNSAITANIEVTWWITTK